ncbi:hypothetical protein J3U18_06895 [Gilliamella sp. B3482]|nr:hypothetical protein [Gilliamella sp. B3482]MCX8581414.1 hypothetical protein [Gilliamella sp. B3482]
MIIEQNIIGISDFKKNPMSFMKENQILLILNHNKKAFYCLSPEIEHDK